MTLARTFANVKRTLGRIMTLKTPFPRLRIVNVMLASKLLLLVIFVNASEAANPALHFDLTQIAPSTLYSGETGYGYEKPATGTVRLGAKDSETTTTIKAELRRLMVEKVHTAPGKFENRAFIVNVRQSPIAGGGEVRLKDREKTIEAWAWDDKITLEFTNSHPGVSSIDIEEADNLPTIYIAGDSTSTDQSLEPFNSWGQMITAFFKPDVAVANHGESGESLRGFIGERRLAKLMSVIKPGDYLLIQMGHNDQKEKGEGVGAFTTYKADLKRFVAEAREHGATPILITSMNRLTFDSAGKITNSLGDYPEAVREAAVDSTFSENKSAWRALCTVSVGQAVSPASCDPCPNIEDDCRISTAMMLIDS